jgi:hypothetical protein
MRSAKQTDTDREFAGSPLAGFPPFVIALTSVNWIAGMF